METLLSEDPVIPNQKFVLLSFISPEQLKVKNSSLRTFKVRGVFNTYEEAQKYVKNLQDFDNNKFDIFIGEIGKWLPWDDATKTDDEKYNDSQKELSKLMKAYNNSLAKDKSQFEERIQNARDEENNKNKKKKKKKKKKNNSSKNELDLDKLREELKLDKEKLDEVKKLKIDNE
jgi:hypothetical protein